MTKPFYRCSSCLLPNTKPDLHFEGDLTDEQKQRLLEIADKCPVHKTIHSEIVEESHLV